jgi:hypothetical protein
VQFQPKSNPQAKYYNNNQSLVLEGNKPFEIMNENYLFQGMGLCELNQKDINHYLKANNGSKYLCNYIKDFLTEIKMENEK